VCWLKDGLPRLKLSAQLSSHRVELFAADAGALHCSFVRIKKVCRQGGGLGWAGIHNHTPTFEVSYFM
jgi:hypothetical protein